MKNIKQLFALTIIAFLFTACAKEEITSNLANAPSEDDAQLVLDETFLDEAGLEKLLNLDAEVTDRAGVQSMVYTLSNEASGNEVIAFQRNDDGTISESGRYSTGGTGTDSGLGNQGALAMSNGGKFLFVVNPGSDEISYFVIKNDGSLQLKNKIGSGGDLPVSIAFRNNLVYVLNAGGTGNITGFGFDLQGNFKQVENSTKALSSPAAGAAQIGFSTNGKVLIVTEKATNTISSYPVLCNGQTGSVQTFPAAGSTPFGFAFGSFNNFYVSEAAGGAAGASTISTYHVATSGKVSLVKGPLATNQTAACWVALTKDNHTMFATNTGSNNISSFNVSDFGTVTVSNGGSTTPSATTPIDAALDKESKNLYVLTSGSDAIISYKIGSNGNLIQVDMDDAGLPDRMNGLVAR